MTLIPRWPRAKRKSRSSSKRSESVQSDSSSSSSSEEELRELYVKYLAPAQDAFEKDTLRKEIRKVSMVNGMEDLAERKWKQWEEREAESNRAALETVRKQYELLLQEPNGYSLKEMPTLPFLGSTVELLSKSEEEITKTHYGDFLFHYNYIGLSEMELRSLLAILPTSYPRPLDPLGHKVEWRKQVRQRLFDMLVDEHEMRQVEATIE